MSRKESGVVEPEAGSRRGAVRAVNAPPRPNSTQTWVSTPPGTTSTRMSARAREIPEARTRPTVGSPAVRKTTSAPWVVPAELCATRRTWYSAPGARPVTVSETATAPRLEPTDLTTVRVP
ncbi:MAG TPA: hypothetical protein VJM07_08895 [Gaiella sp.]|nr:hypothetical protein [Gaiella sp.]